MRRLLAGVAAAFLLGGLASAAHKHAALVSELKRRQDWMLKDLARVEKAIKDVIEISEMRASGEYVLSKEEKRMERKGRQHFQIFLERIRNDTLETLEIYDRVLNKEGYVEPLRKLFGRKLVDTVAVDWQEDDIETVVEELGESYGVSIHLGGEINRRRTMSLSGEMSLMSILLYIENVYDAELVLKNNRLWIRRRDAAEPEKK